MQRIWIISEQVFGNLVTLNSYFSRVTFEKDGILYDVMIENDEFEIVEEGLFIYE